MDEPQQAKGAENHCSRCSTLMERRDAITRAFPIAGVLFSVTMPGWECPNDGTTVFAPEVVRSMFDRAARLVATRGPRTPVGFKFMRGQLRLEVATLAELLGVAPAAVEEWEAGAAPVSPLAWAAIASMYLESLGAPTPIQVLLRPASAPATEPVALDLRDVAA